MQLVKGKVVPRGTLDPPHELGDRAVLHAGLGGIALHVHDKPSRVVRQVFVVVQAKAGVSGVAGDIVIPVAPAGAHVHAHAAVLDKQAVQLGVGVLVHLTAPMDHGILGGGEPLGTDTDELPVAHRHGPHGADHAPVNGFDDDACLGVGDAIGGIQGGVAAAPHKVAAHQDIQSVIAVLVDLVGVIELGDVIGTQLGHLESADQDHSRVLPGHLGHGIEAVLGGGGGEHAHIQGGLDGFHIVIVASDIIEVAHPLRGHDLALVIDVRAVVHHGVVVGPAEIFGQADHKVAPGHGVIHLDGVGSGGLAGVQGHGIGGAPQCPGDLHIVAAHAVPHDGGSVRVHRDQVLIGGAPGALALHLAVLHRHQLDGLDKLQSIGLALHVLSHAIDIDAVALLADLLLGGGVRRGSRGDDPAGQNGGNPQARSPDGQTLYKVSAGNAAALHVLLFTTHFVFLLISQFAISLRAGRVPSMLHALSPPSRWLHTLNLDLPPALPACGGTGSCTG